jgi:hypothetical protein
MTQEERWMTKCNEVVTFIETNKRNPSKHRIEEHDMLNWVKANRKRMNASQLKEPRLGCLKNCCRYRNNIDARTSMNRIGEKSAVGWLFLVYLQWV